MKNTTKTIVAAAVLLASLMLAGCTAQPASEEADAQLSSFAEAVLEADEQKLYELFCPEIDTARFISLMDIGGEDGRKRFYKTVSSAVPDRDKTTENEVFYSIPAEDQEGWWVVRKTGDDWCIDIYNETSSNINDDGGELQQKMKEAREQYLEEMKGE